MNDNNGINNDENQKNKPEDIGNYSQNRNNSGPNSKNWRNISNNTNNNYSDAVNQDLPPRDHRHSRNMRFKSNNNSYNKNKRGNNMFNRNRNNSFRSKSNTPNQRQQSQRYTSGPSQTNLDTVDYSALHEITVHHQDSLKWQKFRTSNYESLFFNATPDIPPTLTQIVKDRNILSTLPSATYNHIYYDKRRDSFYILVIFYNIKFKKEKLCPMMQVNYTKKAPINRYINNFGDEVDDNIDVDMKDEDEEKLIIEDDNIQRRAALVSNFTIAISEYINHIHGDLQFYFNSNRNIRSYSYKQHDVDQDHILIAVPVTDARNVISVLFGLGQSLAHFNGKKDLLTLKRKFEKNAIKNNKNKNSKINKNLNKNSNLDVIDSILDEMTFNHYDNPYPVNLGKKQAKNNGNNNKNNNNTNIHRSSKQEMIIDADKDDDKKDDNKSDDKLDDVANDGIIHVLPVENKNEYILDSFGINARAYICSVLQTPLAISGIPEHLLATTSYKQSVALIIGRFMFQHEINYRDLVTRQSYIFGGKLQGYAGCTTMDLVYHDALILHDIIQLNENWENSKQKPLGWNLKVYPSRFTVYRFANKVIREWPRNSLFNQDNCSWQDIENHAFQMVYCKNGNYDFVKDRDCNIIDDIIKRKTKQQQQQKINNKNTDSAPFRKGVIYALYPNSGQLEQIDTGCIIKIRKRDNNHINWNELKVGNILIFTISNKKIDINDDLWAKEIFVAGYKPPSSPQEAAARQRRDTRGKFNKKWRFRDYNDDNHYQQQNASFNSNYSQQTQQQQQSYNNNNINNNINTTNYNNYDHLGYNYNEYNNKNKNNNQSQQTQQQQQQQQSQCNLNDNNSNNLVFTGPDGTLISNTHNLLQQNIQNVKNNNDNSLNINNNSENIQYNDRIPTFPEAVKEWKCSLCLTENNKKNVLCERCGNNKADNISNDDYKEQLFDPKDKRNEKDILTAINKLEIASKGWKLDRPVFIENCIDLLRKNLLKRKKLNVYSVIHLNGIGLQMTWMRTVQFLHSAMWKNKNCPIIYENDKEFMINPQQKQHYNINKLKQIEKRLYNEQIRRDSEEKKQIQIKQKQQYKTNEMVQNKKQQQSLLFENGTDTLSSINSILTTFDTTTAEQEVIINNLVQNEQNKDFVNNINRNFGLNNKNNLNNINNQIDDISLTLSPILSDGIDSTNHHKNMNYIQKKQQHWNNNHNHNNKSNGNHIKYNKKRKNNYNYNNNNIQRKNKQNLNKKVKVNTKPITTTTIPSPSPTIELNSDAGDNEDDDDDDDNNQSHHTRNPNHCFKFNFVHWNIGGIKLYDNINGHSLNWKYSVLNNIFLDFQPSVIALQEVRTHYFGYNKGIKSADNLNNINGHKPPEIEGYQPFYDNLLKNVVYIKNIYINCIEFIKIPEHHQFNNNKPENNHYILWILFHPLDPLPIDQPILFGTYYKSPNRIKNHFDVQYILKDLEYIHKHYQQYTRFHIILCGDFNIKHPVLTPPQYTNSNIFNVEEFDNLEKILLKYKLKIINNIKTPTYWYKINGNKHGSNLDLTIIPECTDLDDYSWNIHQVSDIHHQLIRCDINLYTKINITNNAKTDSWKTSINHWNFSNPINRTLFIHYAVKDIYKLYRKYKNDTIDVDKLDRISYCFYVIINKYAMKYIGTLKNNKNKFRNIWTTKKVVQICNKTRKIWNKYKNTEIKKRKHRWYHIWRRLLRERNKIIYEAKKYFILKLSKLLNIHDNNWWNSIKKLNKFNNNKVDHIPFLYKDSNKDIIIDQDRIKGNLFNAGFCNDGCKNAELGYETLEDLDIENIPTISRNVYPTHDIERAEYIKNEKLIKDYTFDRELEKMNDIITKKEILSALYNLKTNVNHGMGIHIKLILMVIHYIINFIHWLFNLFFRLHHLGNVFKLTLINPIIKPQKNKHFWTNYREISLMGVIRKWFEYILTVKLIEFVINCNLVNNFYMAALKGKRTFDAVAIIMNDILLRWTSNLCTFSAVFDIAKCYPSVKNDVMVNRLIKYYGITENVLYCIEDLFFNAWTSTVVNGIRSRWHILLSGLGQGRTISCILILLFLDQIFGTINKFRFRLILFVDDLILWSILNYQYDYLIINGWFQEQINLINNWLIRNYMRFSIKKTKCITFYNNYIEKHYPERIIKLDLYLEYDNNLYPIDFINHYIKYLGYLLSYNLSPLPHINYIVIKINLAFNTVRNTLKNLHNILAINCIHLIRSSVLSILEYHWLFLRNATKTDLYPLRIIYYKILRYLCGALKTTPIKLLLLFTNLPDLDDWIRSKSALYWFRNLHINDNNPIYYLIDGQIDEYYRKDILQINWWNEWKKYLKIKKFTLKASSRKSILWTSFLSAIDYNILNIIGFDEDTQFCDFKLSAKYCAVLPVKPRNLFYIKAPYKATSHYNLETNTLFIFCDGSLINNFGGIGVYIEKHFDLNILTSQYKINRIGIHEKFIGKSYDINLIELEGILEAILYIKHHLISYLKSKHKLMIICDNLQVIKWMASINNSNNIYIHKLIDRIYRIINDLNDNYHTKILLEWCRRGMFDGNIKADHIAKECVLNGISNQHFQHILTPISMNTMKNIVKTTCINNTKGKLIEDIDKHIICKDLFKLDVPINYNFIADYKKLNHFNLKIIMQLRSHHIKLNLYLHFIEHMDYYKKSAEDVYIDNVPHLKCERDCCKENNSGICATCNRLESVEHFLIICDNYKQQRHYFIHPILSILYQQQIQINLKNILFPPKPLKWRHRKFILEMICLYVRNTKRLFFHSF